MQHLLDAVGYILLFVVAVQGVKLMRWLSPVDTESNTAFSSWPHLLLMGAVIIAFPFRFMPAWEPMRLFWAFLMAAGGFIWHLLWNGAMLARAEKHHGTDKMFWF